MMESIRSALMFCTIQDIL